METSKEKSDRTMDEVKSAKMDGVPTESEVDEVEKEAKSLSEERSHKSHLSNDEKNLLSHLVKSFSEQDHRSSSSAAHENERVFKQSYIEKQRSMKAIYVGCRR